MDVAGKVALITGGARMGEAVAEALAKRGCHVALAYRTSQASANEAAQRARAQGVRSLTLRADLSTTPAPARVMQQTVRRLGRLDILIHMASRYQPTPLKRLDAKTWQAQMDADLRSGYLLAIAAAPVMQRRGAGRIIIIADWTAASHRPRYKDYLPYYVAKAGVIALTEALALELAPSILVNAIAPGPMLKPSRLSAQDDAEVRRATPLGRWGGAEELAKAILFLVETDFMTGECLRVDGGRHLR